MKLKANYHTHVKLCGHAVGMTEDYLKKAVELGYESLGMSDHGPLSRDMMTPEEFTHNWLDRQMTPDIFKNVYLPDMKQAKEKYKDKINFYMGVEIEYIEKFNQYFVDLRKELDYMNLATHFFYYNDQIYNSFEEASYKNIEGYSNTAKKALETGLYSIMVHPDVFMHKYKDVNGQNNWDEHCEKAAKVVIEAAIANNVYLEINCGGLYKVTAAGAVPGEFGYPRRNFWELAAQYKDLKVIIGVDAHDPNQLGAKEIDEAKAFAKKLGIKVYDFCETIEKKMNK